MNTASFAMPEFNRQILDLLTGGKAHLSFESAFAEVPDESWNRIPERQPHSLWHLLEHMRICQWDLLRFSVDPTHKSPQFPDGYWPDLEREVNQDQWQFSLSEFRRDADEFQSLIMNTGDLSADFPHAPGYSLLREALILADHNAYHLGQVVSLRRTLGIWQD
ncbi:MAG: DinB family protein [Aureliella sp.]